MAKTNEKVVEEVVEQPVKTTPVEEPKLETSAEADVQKKIKVKKPKWDTDIDKMYKVNVDEPPKTKKEDGKILQKTKAEEKGDKGETKKEEVKTEKTEQPVLEEITDETPTETESKKEEEVTVEDVKQEIAKTPEVELPENIQKVVDFMNETGGTLEDYVRLNADYSKVDEANLLREYYKQTKSHLNDDEINFLIDDNYAIDKDVDDDRAVKRKTLAYKEAVNDAKKHLEGLKDKYYKEVKLGSKLLPEQQKAVEFFNRYNTEQEQAEKLQSKQKTHFEKLTNDVFDNKFKGFEFNVGDKKYRYNIKDAAKIKDAQQNVIDVFSEYITSDNLLTNAAGYHKSLFAAKNSDAIATHFYEQGKTDAVKEITSKSKNINMDPRKSSPDVIDASGTKVRVLSGDDSSKLKFKLKNY
jgi:hypothetical protein